MPTVAVAAVAAVAAVVAVVVVVAAAQRGRAHLRIGWLETSG